MATPSRVLKVVRHLNRIPEILLCQRHTHQWLKLTSAYVGLEAKLPFEVNSPTGSFQFQEKSDIATFWQIFYRQIYSVDPSYRLIVDAGANIGAFCLYALQKAPQAKVIAIEPAPDSCQRIKAMLRANHLETRCELHEAALGSHRGETTIELDKSSQFRRSGLAGYAVPMETLNDLIPPDVNVDLLKIDIEGAEYELLNSVSGGTLRRVRRIVMEYHPNAPVGKAVQPLLDDGFKMLRLQDDGGGYGVAWFERP